MYNKNRGIAILELSSTAIKAIHGVPKYVLNIRHDLSRFELFSKAVVIKDYINSENKIDVTRYEKDIVPIISEQYSIFFRKNPQVIRIVATGHYRNITNFKELENSINEYITSKLNKKPITIELLSPEEESKYSFISWLKTYKFSEEDKHIQDPIFLVMNYGLNIDVGGGTTEISVFRGEDFGNTVSLPVGADVITQELLNIDEISETVVWQYFIELRKRVSMMLLQSGYEKRDIKYCVGTGSTLLIGGSNEDNFSRKIQLATIGNQIQSNIDEILLEISRKKDKSIPIGNVDKKKIMNLSGLMIFESVLRHFEIDKCYNNLANLRIGVYYDSVEKLKAQR